MPEQAEAQHPAEDVVAVAFGEYLRHHRQQPEQAARHVQAVAANQGEERGEECTACRTGAACDQASELVSFQANEREPEDKGRGHRGIEPGAAVRLGAKHRQAAGKAGKQQASGLDRGVVEVEQLMAAWATRGRTGQYRVGGEEGRKHDDVAEQEDPEAVADNDTLRDDLLRRTRGGAMHDYSGLGAAHDTAPRPMRAASAAGMTSSVRSRQANTTNVA